jgi:hypothetical protein
MSVNTETATKQNLNKERKNFLSKHFFSFIAGVIDTGDQPYFRIFIQIGNGPMGYSGGRGNHEKACSLKFRVRLPLSTAIRVES